MSNRPEPRSTGPNKVSRSRGRSGPRNHCASGTAKALLGAVQYILRNIRFEGRFEDVLAFAPAQLQTGRQPRRPLDQRVVEQRDAHFERAGHTGAVNLGEDVAREIGVEISILHLRQRIVAAAPADMRAQHIYGIIPLQFAREPRAEEPPPQHAAADRYRREISLNRTAR